MGCCMSFLSACDPILTTDALFKDVSRPPPAAPAPVLERIATDAPDLGRWIIYQDRMCDRHGCLSTF